MLRYVWKTYLLLTQVHPNPCSVLQYLCKYRTLAFYVLSSRRMQMLGSRQHLTCMRWLVIGIKLFLQNILAMHVYRAAHIDAHAAKRLLGELSDAQWAELQALHCTP